MKLDEILNRTTNAVTVSRAFGSAYEHEDALIIPVCWVAGGGGAGTGSEPVWEDGAESPAAGSTRGGAGGGYGGVAFPLGVYVVRRGEVRWVPALDVSRLALGGLALLRAVVTRRRRSHNA
jgi:uncharacterized spore protein YtfJ